MVGRSAASGQGQTRAGRRSLAAHLSAPIQRFLNTEAGSAGLLLAATIVALLWANSPWSSAYEALWHTQGSVSLAGWQVSMDLAHWVNDGLMALFFFVVGLEVRREFSVGELAHRRGAAIPILAALGGLTLPAVLYLAFSPSGEAGDGWGVVIGTDTAFMLGALAVVGPTFSSQLRVFLLTLTAVDDIIAVSVIGVFYSRSLHLPALIVMLVASAVLYLLSRLGVWRAVPYLLVGTVLWLAAFAAGLHAAIAGMLGGLLVAAHAPAREAVEGAARRFHAFRQSPGAAIGRSANVGIARAVSVNERLQASLHPWASYVIVPLFALANAGVDLRHGVLVEALTSRITWVVAGALVVGKLLGIGLTSLVGVRAGLGKLPAGVGMGHVFGGAALSGIGFTVALLIAGLAFRDPLLRDQAVVGVFLAALIATPLGWLIFRMTAMVRGDADADLPRFLDRPVDPDSDYIRGRPDAPLTIVEYADFECPFCARATGVAAELRERFGDDLLYAFRHLPLYDVHPHAELAAQAAVAAGAQGRFWQMHDMLFAHQDRLEFEDIVGYAADLGLDVDTFLRDLDSDETAARIRADVASAEASGARGTPTFYIGTRRHTGPHDTETLARALEASRHEHARRYRP